MFTQVARGRVEDALGGIEAGPQKEAIFEQGKKEANRNLELAVGGLILAVIPFVGGEIKRRRS